MTSKACGLSFVDSANHQLNELTLIFRCFGYWVSIMFGLSGRILGLVVYTPHSGIYNSQTGL